MFRLLDDAAPLVSVGCWLFRVWSRAGGGLFWTNGKIFGEIGPAFYDLRTRLLTPLLMALLRRSSMAAALDRSYYATEGQNRRLRACSPIHKPISSVSVVGCDPSNRQPFLDAR